LTTPSLQDYIIHIQSHIVFFTMLSSVNRMMWQIQDMLHKTPQVVPGALLGSAGSLIVYHHMTHEGEEHEADPIRTFLAMIVVQMLPLVALEMKIMSCADPVGLFCKFATPVTLLHAFFLGMRLLMYNNYDSTCLATSALGFVGAILTMVVGFRQSLSNIIACYSVWSLVALAFVAAVSTQALDQYVNPQTDWDSYGAAIKENYWTLIFSNSLEYSNSYIELLAFVPAVLMLYRENRNESRYQVESTDTKRTATAFFLFLVGFYITEDLVNAYHSYQLSGLASLAHVAHFILLVDFACFVLAHIYNPEKLVGELHRWLPVDFSHEV